MKNIKYYNVMYHDLLGMKRGCSMLQKPLSVEKAIEMLKTRHPEYAAAMKRFYKIS